MRLALISQTVWVYWSEFSRFSQRNHEPRNCSLKLAKSDFFRNSYFSIIFYDIIFGILHSPVYTFFEKAYVIDLNADVETGNSKLGNVSTSLCFSQFQISSFKFYCQNTRTTKCKLTFDLSWRTPNFLIICERKTPLFVISTEGRNL